MLSSASRHRRRHQASISSEGSQLAKRRLDLSGTVAGFVKQELRMEEFGGPSCTALGLMRSLAQRERAIQWDEMLNKVPDNHGLQQPGAKPRPSTRC
jgi:hypothetical protein